MRLGGDITSLIHIINSNILLLMSQFTSLHIVHLQQIYSFRFLQVNLSSLHFQGILNMTLFFSVNLIQSCVFMLLVSLMLVSRIPFKLLSQSLTAVSSHRFCLVQYVLFSLKDSLVWRSRVNTRFLLTPFCCLLT